MNQVLSRRYQLLEQIGSGGMAVIYKAKDLQTDRIVAIKILREEYARDKEFVARFDREARAMQRVRHSSIVEVYALGRSHGIYRRPHLKRPFAPSWQNPHYAKRADHAKPLRSDSNRA